MSYCGLVDVRINASDNDLPVNSKVLYNRPVGTVWVLVTLSETKGQLISKGQFGVFKSTKKPTFF